MLAGRPFKVEMGKMCGLSNASALIRYGETCVMCNIVSASLFFGSFYPKSRGARIIAINPASLPAGTGVRFTAAIRCHRYFVRMGYMELYIKQRAGTFAVPALR